MRLPEKGFFSRKLFSVVLRKSLRCSGRLLIAKSNLAFLVGIYSASTSFKIARKSRSARPTALSSSRGIGLAGSARRYTPNLTQECDSLSPGPSSERLHICLIAVLFLYGPQPFASIARIWDCYKLIKAET